MNKFLSSTLVVFTLLGASSHAAITISGDFQNGTTTPTLTVTEDITLTVTSNASVSLIVFDEWVTSDGGATVVMDSPVQEVSVSVNSAPDNIDLSSVIDNIGFSLGDLTANDGYLSLNPYAVSTGQTFTVKAGSYTFDSDTSFNSTLTEGFTFTGDVFLTTNSGVRISNAVAAPEPTTAILSAVGLLTLVGRRRR